MDNQRSLTSKRDELNNRIAATPVGEDVSSLLAARNWYNRANWCYVCDRPAEDCACELDPNGPLPQSACMRQSDVASLDQRSLKEIAEEIIRDWNHPRYLAQPYLNAMLTMDSIDDRYGVVTGYPFDNPGADAGTSIVAFFIGNASSWRGPTARRIKQELRSMLLAAQQGGR